MTRDMHTLRFGRHRPFDRLEKPVVWLVSVAQFWFLYCLFGGSHSEVFRSASDRLEAAAPLLAFTVVNPALHLALVVVSVYLFAWRQQPATTAAFSLASLNAALIAAHIATSLITV